MGIEIGTIRFEVFGNAMKALAFLCLALVSSPIQADSKDRPNVIVIMTDDQGYGELSVHGNPILKTPELDKLHNQSLRLTDFHVAPMCTPTRGQLLTGIDAAKNGAINVSSGRSLLRKELKTMADYFSAGGYRTGIFGKWHLGDNYPYRPEDRGFEETLWFPSSHIGSVPDYWGNDYFDDVYIQNGERKAFKGYCTDVFFDHAMNWMSQCVEKGEPFFVYLPTNAPHQPFHAIEKDIKEMENVVEGSEFSELAPSLKHDLIRYLAMIRNIDQNMGELMDFLSRKRIAENTILIFLTDNGSTFGPDYYNAGMRGKKTQLWEGGHRVPFFIKWPDGNLLPPRDIDGLAQVQDVLPTLAELCQLDVDTCAEFDGISLAPVLQGKRQIDGDRVMFINYSYMPFYFDYPSPYSNSLMTKEGGAVLWKKWRLLNDRELYNLSEDPLQTQNVVNEYPEIAAFMRQALESHWSSIETIANEPQRIAIGSTKENPILLSACEWMDVFVDQQNQVLNGVQKNSYWLLDVEKAGTYTFELRRWPKELDIPLSQHPTSESALALINAARIFINAEGQSYRQAKPVSLQDNSAIFRFELEAGPIALHTWFDGENGEPIFGAYYVYVNKIK